MDDVRSVLTFSAQDTFVISKGVTFDSVATREIPIKEGMCGFIPIREVELRCASDVCHEGQVHASPFRRSRVDWIISAVCVSLQ